jgi:hypothetical protein
VSRFHQARVAITTEGAVVINVARLDSSRVASLVARALDDKVEVFVGVVVSPQERDELMKRFEDLAGDVVGDLGADHPGGGS